MWLENNPRTNQLESTSLLKSRFCYWQFKCQEAKRKLGANWRECGTHVVGKGLISTLHRVFPQTRKEGLCSGKPSERKTTREMQAAATGIKTPSLSITEASIQANFIYQIVGVKVLDDAHHLGGWCRGWGFPGALTGCRCRSCWEGYSSLDQTRPHWP